LKYGWTFDQIADMSLDQILIAWNEGKSEKGIPIASEDDVWAMRQDRRRWANVLE
jgi:hypothetical protein